MSTTLAADLNKDEQVYARNDKRVATPQTSSNYKGFVAGVFSGIAKLSGMSIDPGVMVFRI